MQPFKGVSSIVAASCHLLMHWNSGIVPSMAVLWWAWERVKGAVNSWVEALILAAGIAVALLMWRVLKPNLSDELSVPMWLVAIVAGGVLAVTVIQGLRLHERGGHVAGMATIAMQIEQARAMTAAYAEHLTEILYTFQRVLNGDIPGVTVKEWMEDGILEPARELIRTRQIDDVRLSILVPDGEDFVMAFSAGHTLESKTNFRLAIDSSFSQGAYRNNLIVWSGDLTSDERFTRHPKATRERDYNSIICVPIRRGDRVVGVFNTIFTSPGAFDEADLLYVRLVGAVIELVWSLTNGPDGGGDDFSAAHDPGRPSE